MRKVVLYIAMSIDGYIADKNGGVSWLSGDGSDTDNMGSYPTFIETVDTVILGYKTYEQIVTELSPNEWPYKGKKTYVMTHRRMEDTEEIIFVDESLDKLIAKLKQQQGKDIWVCGGASIINQLVQRDLIEKYHLTMIPTILGAGIRLFDIFEVEHRLRLIETNVYNGMVDLVYEPRIEG